MDRERETDRNRERERELGKSVFSCVRERDRDMDRERETDRKRERERAWRTIEKAFSIKVQSSSETKCVFQSLCVLGRGSRYIQRERERRISREIYIYTYIEREREEGSEGGRESESKRERKGERHLKGRAVFLALHDRLLHRLDDHAACRRWT